MHFGSQRLDHPAWGLGKERDEALAWGKGTDHGEPPIRYCILKVHRSQLCNTLSERMPHGNLILPDGKMDRLHNILNEISMLR